VWNKHGVIERDELISVHLERWIQIGNRLSADEDLDRRRRISPEANRATGLVLRE